MFSLSLILLTSRLRLCLVQEFRDTEACGDKPMIVSSPRLHVLGLIEYELNSLVGAWHLVDYMSVHIQFDLERCANLNTRPRKWLLVCIMEKLRKRSKHDRNVLNT